VAQVADREHPRDAGLERLEEAALRHRQVAPQGDRIAARWLLPLDPGAFDGQLEREANAAHACCGRNAGAKSRLALAPPMRERWKPPQVIEPSIWLLGDPEAKLIDDRIGGPPDSTVKPRRSIEVDAGVDSRLG